MAEIFIDSDINVNGKVKAATVPNATGTVVTYNSTTKEFSTRTNAQIISDLGIDGNLTAYVKKAGDTMTGSLTMNAGANVVINKDLSTITTAGGFARDMFRLTGTNGITDVFGWQGNVDATGNVTLGYGYLGGASYSVKNAIRWNSNQQVRIGSTGAPTGSYALEADGNVLARGNSDVTGAFNSSSGELIVQRLGVNRIRTGSNLTILSADQSNGIVYLRPQGDAVATSQVQFRSDNTAVLPDTYNIYFGSQTTAGSDLFHTNLSNTSHGYGLWMGQNLQFNGTDFIQPRGSLTSWGFTVNNHKNFSFNYGSATGTNGSIPTLTEVVKINNTGTITTLNDGNSTQWNSAVNNGFLYRGILSGAIDLNTITQTGWWVQTGNANATPANNYPVALAGQLRVYYTATHIVQEYTTYANNNDVYRRYYFNGIWYAWAKDWDSGDFSLANIASWNDIAANGATKQWVDQFYVNKSTQNIVKTADWFITDDTSAGMEGKFRFQGGYPVIQWDQSSALFGDEGFIDLTNYGIRQNNNNPNEFVGYTNFFGGAGFALPQGTAPFNVISSTVVTNLNADLLDGFHASDFATNSQLGNYISKSPLQFRAVADSKNAIGVDFFYSPSSDPNKPSGVVDGALLNMTYDNSLWNSQLYSDWRTNEWYVRTKSNGSWGSFQKLWHNGNFNPATLVPTSRTISINGVTQDLSANRSWTTPDTITRLRGGGSFVSGDITISAGANVTVSQSGQTITVAATDTNTTYTAGSGLTLTGTTFSANFGTTAGTIAQGNDPRIINGQTAFSWGNHAGLYLPLTGGTLTGRLDINSTNGVGSFRSSAASNNYLTWVRHDGTNPLAYLGADGGGANGGGVGYNFAIRVPAGDLQLVSDSGIVTYNGNEIATKVFLAQNYALRAGSNATDTWVNASHGLVNNPAIPGKIMNSSGDVYLSEATYGKVMGMINSSGIAAGNPTDNWFHRIKMLHDNVGGYYTEIAVQMTGGNGMHYKRYEAGVDQGWIKVWDSSNFNPVNYVTVTGAAQTITSPKTFNTNVTISGTTSTNAIVDLNGGWMLNNDVNGGEYGLYPQDNQDALIAGVENNYFVYGTDYNTFNGIAINKTTKAVTIGGAAENNKLNVNGAVEASGLVSNSVPQSNTVAWTTDGGTIDVSSISGKITQQYNLIADSSGFVPTFENNIDLISIFYVAGGSGNNSKIFLPKKSRSGQEITIMNNSDYSTIVCNANTPLDILGIAPGDALRLIFVIDFSGTPTDIIQDKEGDGSWVLVNHFKGLRVFS